LCVTVRPLFTPTLSKAGLKSDRVFYLEGGDDKTVLASATAEATLSWRKLARLPTMFIFKNLSRQVDSSPSERLPPRQRRFCRGGGQDRLVVAASR